MKTLLTSLIIVAASLTASCSRAPVIRFLDNACIVEGNRYHYKTCERMVVLIDKDKVVVPKNFKTDLASIPRQLWSIYSPAKSETMAASILHDYLYNCPNIYSRKEADDIFYYSLLTKDISAPRAFLYWSAVRAFGDSAYKPTGPCPSDIF